MRKASLVQGLLVCAGTFALVPVAFGQRLSPAGSPQQTASWEGGASVSFVSTLQPEVVDGWDVRAIVEPASRPVVVRLSARRGKMTEETVLLSFEVRGTGEGLEEGRTYRCLAPLDPHARPSEAKRFLLMGYRPNGHDRLQVAAYSRLDRLMGEGGTTVAAGPGTLFASVLAPTQARSLALASDPAAAAYRNVVQALKGAPATTVRQATLAIAQVPEQDSPVAPKIEGRPASAWISSNLSSALAALPTPTDLERFRYGGLLAQWDRPHRALAYLKSLPSLRRNLLNDENALLSRRLPGDSDEDGEFLNRLNLVEGVDPDALFDAVWNTEMRRFVIDPHMSRAPSVENQRRALEYLDHPNPNVRAEAYRRLAGWNNDLPRSLQATVRWSDAVQGEAIENEQALRGYWEAKLGVAPKP